MLRNAFAGGGTLLLSALLLPAAWAATPSVLRCQVDANTELRVSFDGAGRPAAVGASVVAGTRDCEIDSAAPPRADADGKTWHFDAWREPLDTQRGSARLRREASGWSLAWQPAACGALALPAERRLGTGQEGCWQEPDRAAMLDDFWQQLRRALSAQDGVALVALAQARPKFGGQAAERGLLGEGIGCIVALPLRTAPQPLALSSLLGDAQAMRGNLQVRWIGRDRVRIGQALELAWQEGSAVDGHWAISAVGAEPDRLRGCASH